MSASASGRDRLATGRLGNNKTLCFERKEAKLCADKSLKHYPLLGCSYVRA